MTPPIYRLAYPDGHCDCEKAFRVMVLIFLVRDVSTCVTMSQGLPWTAQVIVDCQECGGGLGCVVGKVQEDTRLFFHVEGGSYVEANLAHFPETRLEGRHGAHVLDSKPRGIWVEPGEFVWGLEASLSERPVPTAWLGPACHLEACRYDCLDLVARL